MNNTTMKTHTLKTLSLVLLLLCLVVTGCHTSATRLTRLNLDMSKTEVRQIIGSPASARGSMRNKYGQVIEVWDYVLSRDGKPVTYWLFFYDDKLGRWGAAGDWNKEADRIYEYRFGPADTHLTQ
jgi:outer membrane protein assembly factor BamE (lipoprotein component of BamABCDE complex)